MNERWYLVTTLDNEEFEIVSCHDNHDKAIEAMAEENKPGVQRRYCHLGDDYLDFRRYMAEREETRRRAKP